MNLEWPVFLFGFLIFLVMSAAILLLYAAAAAEQAAHEQGVLARLTLRICRYLGFAEATGPDEEQSEGQGEGRRPAE